MPSEIQARSIIPEVKQRPSQTRFMEDPVRTEAPLPLALGEEKRLITVVKFGGYSMSTPERVQKSAEIMHADPDRRRIAVVVAPGEKVEDPQLDSDKSVDSLLKQICRMQSRDLRFDRPFYAVRDRFHEYTGGLEESSFVDRLMGDLYKDIDRQESEARIMSYGPKIMSHVFARVAGGSNAEAADYIYIKNGQVLDITYNMINMGLPREGAGFDVIGGGYGADESRNIERFPSPGGNYTASILAAGLNASALEIYKNIPGFLSSDPDIVDNPPRIKEMTYTEMRAIDFASETPVVPQESVLPAIKNNIPIHVNSLDHPEEGTKIVSKIVPTAEHPRDTVVAVVGKGEMTSFRLRRAGIHEKEGVIEKVSHTFAEDMRSIGQLTTGIDKVAILVDDSQFKEGGRKVGMDETEAKLNKIANVKTREGLGAVCVIGEEISNHASEVIAKVTSSLDREDITLRGFAYTGGEDIIFSVDMEQLHPAMRATHAACFEEKGEKSQ